MPELNLNLEDGKEKIYINKAKYGEDRVIYVNLTDVNLFARAKDAKENIQKFIEGVDVPEDGESEVLIDKITEIDQYTRQQIDYIFDYKCSDAVFGKTFTTANISGKTYVERFLDAIIPKIEQNIKRYNEKIQKRTSKYTNKYLEK